MQGEIDSNGREEWPKPILVKEVLLEDKADVGRLGRPIAMTTAKVCDLGFEYFMIERGFFFPCHHIHLFASCGPIAPATRGSSKYWWWTMAER